MNYTQKILENMNAFVRNQMLIRPLWFYGDGTYATIADDQLAACEDKFRRESLQHIKAAVECVAANHLYPIIAQADENNRRNNY